MMRLCEFLVTKSDGAEVIATLGIDGARLVPVSGSLRVLDRVHDQPSLGVDADDDPIEWFDNLPKQYSGSHFRAQIIEGDEAEKVCIDAITKFDANQPRDYHGRWSAGLGSGAGVAGEKSPEEIRRHVEENKKSWGWTDKSKYAIALGKEMVENVVNRNPELAALLNQQKDIGDQLSALRKKSEKANEAYKLQTQAFENKWPYQDWEQNRNKPEYKKELDALMKDGKVNDKLLEQRNELNRRYRDLNYKAEMEFGSAMRAQMEENGRQWGHPVGWDLSDISHDKKGNQATTLGEASWTVMTGGAPRNVSGAVVRLTAAPRIRSSMDAKNDTMYFNAKTADSGTFVHEMGHWYEFHTPGGYDAAKAFILTRTHRDKPIPLQNFGKDYDPWEMTRPDKFIHPYVGKVYPEKTQGTEVTSMGMQLMHESMDGFRRAAPEHFYFTVGMIQAGQMGGYPWAEGRKPRKWNKAK